MEGTCGEADPKAVTPLDVANYRRHLQNKNRKPVTVNNALDAIGSFFTWAKESGIVESDPTEGVKRLPEQKAAPKWLDRRELGALMRAVQKRGSKKDQVLISLLLHTGLRVSEAAVSLKAKDVVIREHSGHVVVRHGKGSKYREVPLNATARRILSGYLADLSGEWLFPGKNGPMTRRVAEKVIAKYARLAGVKVTPHSLRHTFCKMLVDAGESLDRVAMLAGHENLNTTARYTRPGKADLEKAVEKIAWE
ncbi:tyrosine-type recombinase/integrase [Syntrophothermus sp.]|uniref:tyrosine-type recombinase/integrase n=1 Tax=Syntrophothermus sp. TaxID=2736299 RepID=UPI00257F7CF8|nr:tyrosine-type recombinase/integrase [Syntrophothermus sp.]